MADAEAGNERQAPAPVSERFRRHHGGEDGADARPEEQSRDRANASKAAHETPTTLGCALDQEHHRARILAAE
jgi:hypothetical protein